MPTANKQSVAIRRNTTGMAGVFWTASELSRRGCVALPTARNLKTVDIYAARPESVEHGGGRAKIVELQVKTILGRGFWLLGNDLRKIPNRRSLFFVFVCPESKAFTAPFEAFVVPSRTVHVEAKQQGKLFCWYYPNKPKRYKGRWDTLGLGLQRNAA